MDKDGFAGRCGKVELGDEGGLLCGDVGIVNVIVVEAYLAAGNSARVGGEDGELGECFRRRGERFLRVDSSTRVDGGKVLRMG